MEQKKRRFAVLTGGGDCPGLNAVIRAVVKTFLQNDCEVYGVLNGFNGLINDNLKLMDYAAVSGILPRGGTILGTTNRDNPFHFAVEENGELVYKDMREKVIENLRKYDIEALVVIGGDGSLNIGAELARECDIKVVGVPKTIDNDLPCTERTFGFDTAMAMATEALDRLQTLFVPVFHINTDSLMRKLSKKFTIVTAWPGYIDNGNLCYDKFDGTEAIRISPDGFKIWNVEG